jgi:hypothetical protein
MFGPPFWIGALAVSVWMAFDFHEPFTSREVKYSTTPRRYWLGRSFYIGSGFFAYIIVVLLAIVSLKLLSPSFFLIENGRVINSWVASAIAIIALTAASYTPIGKNVQFFIRKVSQDIALFPYELNSLVTVISRSPFHVSDDVRSKVVKELCRYGATAKSISAVIAQPAIRALNELYSLQLTAQGIGRSEQFRSFSAENAIELGQLEDACHSLFRRVGCLIALDERDIEHDLNIHDLRGSVWLRGHSLVISEFASETAMKLIMQYRMILAKIAVSYCPGVNDRAAFLSKAGYSDGNTTSLPFWSLTWLFLLFWILFVALMVSVRIGIVRIPNAVTIERMGLIVMATGTAGAQMVAILWALLPKVAVSSFARASHGKQPYVSYAVFGACSYMTALVISLLVVGGSSVGPLAALPWKGAFVFSLMSVVTTVGASVLIDRHLSDKGYEHPSKSLRDGLTLSLVFLLSNFFVQGIAEVSRIPHTYWFLLIWAVVGFLIGYLLPSSVASHLVARELDIERDVSGNVFVKEIERRDAFESGANEDSIRSVDVSKVI